MTFVLDFAGGFFLVFVSGLDEWLTVPFTFSSAEIILPSSPTKKNDSVFTESHTIISVLL